MKTDASAGLQDVHAEADAATASGGARVDSDARGLDREGQSGISGLGGLISGLASAVLGRVRKVVAGVRDTVGDVVGALRRQGGDLLKRLTQQVRSVVDRVRTVVDRVIDSAISLVLDIAKRIGSVIAALRAAVERIAGLLRSLASTASRLWSQLRSMVAAGWNRLKGALASLRGRAAALLPAPDCTACEFRDAAQRAERVAETGVGNLDLGSALAGLKIALKRTGGTQRATPPAARVVARLGSGRSLAGDVRGRMERAFGRSFDAVEVHTDDAAGRLADEMDARAFTVGHHVGFGAAQYQPGTLVGDALLAHELAHVAQGSGRVATAARSDRSDDGEQTDGHAESAAEHDADETAVAVVTRLWSGQGGDPVPISAAIRAGLTVRRCPKCCEIQPPTGALAPVLAEHDGKPLLQSFEHAQESKQQNKQEGEKDDRYSMGLTGLVMGPVKDAADMTATPGRKCDELCEVNTERLPTFALSPFYAVGAGSYARPGGAYFRRDTKENVPWACRGKNIKNKTFRVTPAVAEQATAAEIEHRNDLELGWNRSVAKWLGAVKELGKGFCTPEGTKCEQQFKELVTKRSGVANPVAFMNCAQSVSGSRDEPDVHIFRAPRVVEVKADCSEAIYEFPLLTKLGNESSESLIDHCGK